MRWRIRTLMLLLVIAGLAIQVVRMSMSEAELSDQVTTLLSQKQSEINYAEQAQRLLAEQSQRLSDETNRLWARHLVEIKVVYDGRRKLLDQELADAKQQLGEARRETDALKLEIGALIDARPPRYGSDVVAPK